MKTKIQVEYEWCLYVAAKAELERKDAESFEDAIWNASNADELRRCGPGPEALILRTLLAAHVARAIAKDVHGIGITISMDAEERARMWARRYVEQYDPADRERLGAEEAAWRQKQREEEEAKQAKHKAITEKARATRLKNRRTF